MSAATNHPGVEYDAGTGADHYLGKPEALVAAGLLAAHQLPGSPGMPSTSVVFVDGVQQPRTARPVHNERWMQVTRIGRKMRLAIGISAQERRDRTAAEEERNRRLFAASDPGPEAAAKALLSSSALFQEGDSVLVFGYAAMVVKGFGIHAVRNDEGAYLWKGEARMDYRPGYVVRYRSGEEIFAVASDVTTPEGEIGYLRAVGGGMKARQPVLAFRGQQ